MKGKKWIGDRESVMGEKQKGTGQDIGNTPVQDIEERRTTKS